MTRSSGNVFRDLGFAPEEAEHLLIRSDLMTKIAKLLKARRLKQAETAKAMGVSQLRVSDLRRGRIDLFSTDALIDMLATFFLTRSPDRWVGGSAPMLGTSVSPPGPCPPVRLTER